MRQYTSQRAKWWHAPERLLPLFIATSASASLLYSKARTWHTHCVVMIAWGQRATARDKNGSRLPIHHPHHPSVGHVRLHRKGFGRQAVIRQSRWRALILLQLNACDVWLRTFSWPSSPHRSVFPVVGGARLGEQACWHPVEDLWRIIRGAPLGANHLSDGRGRIEVNEAPVASPCVSATQSLS
jgi:hypothetical protein